MSSHVVGHSDHLKLGPSKLSSPSGCSLKGQAGSTMTSRKRAVFQMALALAVPFTAFVGLSKLVNVGEIKEPVRELSACGVRCLSGRKSLTARLTGPYVGDDPLPMGSLVGYELEVPGNFLHAGIYLGRGNEDLKSRTGISNLDPDVHYVIEYSGPTRTSGMPQSSAPGRIKSGKGGQNIWITEMEACTEWFVFELDSSHYGDPYPGPATKERALGALNTTFGGYDAFTNNCQHFAVWSRHGVKSMLLGDEGKKTIGRHVGGMAAFGIAGAIGWTPLVIGVWALGVLNILTARTGSQVRSSVRFRRSAGQGRD